MATKPTGNRLKKSKSNISEPTTLSPKIIEKKQQTKKFLLDKIEQAMCLIEDGATMTGINLLEIALGEAKKMWPRFEQKTLDLV